MRPSHLGSFARTLGEFLAAAATDRREERSAARATQFLPRRSFGRLRHETRRHSKRSRAGSTLPPTCGVGGGAWLRVEQCSRLVPWRCRLGNLLVENGQLSAVIDFARQASAIRRATCRSPGRCSMKQAARIPGRRFRSTKRPGRVAVMTLWKALIVAAEMPGTESTGNRKIAAGHRCRFCQITAAMGSNFIPASCAATVQPETRAVGLAAPRLWVPGSLFWRALPI